MKTKSKTFTKVPFRRTVRRFNECLMITIPFDLVNSAKLKPGQELDFTMLVDFENSESQSSLATPIKA